jgi:hypothetical protein
MIYMNYFLNLTNMISVSRENHITYNLIKSLQMLHPATVQWKNEFSAYGKHSINGHEEFQE